MDVGFADIYDGAMAVKLLFDGGGHQIGHGLDPLGMTFDETFEGGGDPKDS